MMSGYASGCFCIQATKIAINLICGTESGAHTVRPP
jgi:hypothetical protein